MANLIKLANFLLILLFFWLKQIQIRHVMAETPQKLKGLSLKLIDYDSVMSPLYNKNLTNEDRMRNAISRSKRRLEHIASKVTTQNTSSSHNSLNPQAVTRPPATTQDFQYLVEVGIGTFDSDPPWETHYLVFDTGSDLTWTQCEGCQNCFPQEGGYFRASQSHSYYSFPCYDCPSSSACQDNNCITQKSYADGSSVKAIGATENFFFRSDTPDSYVRADGVLFGCGIDMQGFLEGEETANKMSGIMGLGRGRTGLGHGGWSFMELEDEITDGKLSYCLQLPFSQGLPPMLLRFGPDAVVPTQESHTTPLIINPHNEELYYLQLQGITVGSTRLNLPTDFFDIKEDGSGGCMIDSGTSVTQIHPDAYSMYENEVIKIIESLNHNVERMNPPPQQFKLCYKVVRDPDSMSLPNVIFHFGNNADFRMEALAVFFRGKDSDGRVIFCSTIIDSPVSFSAFGAYQQTNHRVLYDIKASQLTFGPEDCSQGL